MGGLALAAQTNPKEALLAGGEPTIRGLADDYRAAGRKGGRETEAGGRADGVALLARHAEPGDVAEPRVEEKLDRRQLGGDLALRVAGAAARDAALVGANEEIGRNDVEMGAEKDSRLAPGREYVRSALSQGEGADRGAEPPQLRLEKGKGGGLAAGRRIRGAELRQ